jgi:hypothetical protein
VWLKHSGAAGNGRPFCVFQQNALIFAVFTQSHHEAESSHHEAESSHHGAGAPCRGTEASHPLILLLDEDTTA